LFVDHDRQAIDIIERNLRKTKVEAKTRHQDVFEFLQRQCGSHQTDSLGKLDLIFADPPYEQMQSGENFTDKLLNNDSLIQVLADDGIFVLEKRPGEGVPETRSWSIIRQKAYGATEVLFLIPDPQSPARNASHSDAGGALRNPKFLQ
jgi:16S rRNA G966 N2-methylase RsmD